MPTYNAYISLGTDDPELLISAQSVVNESISLDTTAGMLPYLPPQTIADGISLDASAALSAQIVPPFSPSGCRTYYVPSENRTLKVGC